jgi:hypothetical protein
MKKHPLISKIISNYLTNQLNDSMEPSISWEVDSFLTVQEIHRTHKRLPLFWSTPIQSLPPHSTCWRSILILHYFTIKIKYLFIPFKLYNPLNTYKEFHELLDILETPTIYKEPSLCLTSEQVTQITQVFLQSTWSKYIKLFFCKYCNGIYTFQAEY